MCVLLNLYFHMHMHARTAHAWLQTAHTAVCGDRSRLFGEHCDDGNDDNHDGCTRLCLIECGFVCRMQHENRDEFRSVCGDGIISGAEVCDDGNQRSNDGCSRLCDRIELTYVCTTEASDKQGCQRSMKCHCRKRVFKSSSVRFSSWLWRWLQGP